LTEWCDGNNFRQRLISSTNPEGEVTTFTYDLNNNQTSKTLPIIIGVSVKITFGLRGLGLLAHGDLIL
jgi:YD repeat-containing protein